MELLVNMINVAVHASDAKAPTNVPSASQATPPIAQTTFHSPPTAKATLRPPLKDKANCAQATLRPLPTAKATLCSPAKDKAASPPTAYCRAYPSSTR